MINGMGFLDPLMNYRRFIGKIVMEEDKNPMKKKISHIILYINFYYFYLLEILKINERY
jgi:hypothetical protein